MPEYRRTLRWTFVGMLFALAIAQIAIYTADLFTLPTLGANALAPGAHLLLGLLVVSASWVGWTLSEAPGNEQPVVSVFGLPFIVLLLDILLVVV